MSDSVVNTFEDMLKKGIELLGNLRTIIREFNLSIIVQQNLISLLKENIRRNDIQLLKITNFYNDNKKEIESYEIHSLKNKGRTPMDMYLIKFELAYRSADNLIRRFVYNKKHNDVNLSAIIYQVLQYFNLY